MTKRKPKRRRSAIVELLNGALTLFILGVVAVAGLIGYGAYKFYEESDLPEGTTFYVEQGNGLSQVADDLASQKLIDNATLFKIGIRAMKVDGTIRHGEYAIPAQASMADILEAIMDGKPIEYAVTIPEGFTSWQVVQRLNAEDRLSGDVAAIPAEGSLLPNTYTFRRGDDRNKILEQMKLAHDEKLAAIWESRNPEIPVKTPEELVILASIVEKETGVDTERPEVAAVFTNRLNFNMRLQSDPTIIYGITKGEGALGRPLRKSEIEAKNDYNTYQINGLPKGPIANPGEAAMRAVANPAETKSLYFVAAGATPSDGHLFAESYAEHRKNVAKYRQALKDAAKAEEAETEAARDALEEEQAKDANGG